MKRWLVGLSWLAVLCAVSPAVAQTEGFSWRWGTALRAHYRDLFGGT